MKTFDFWLYNMLQPATVPGALFYGVIIAAAAWLLGRAVHLAVHRRLDRAQADGADPTVIRFLGQLARLMVYLIAFVCYAHLVPPLQKLGTDMLQPATVPGALFYGAIVATAAWLLGRAVHLAVHRRLDEAQAQGADPTGIRFLGQLARLMVYIVAFVCYTHLVPPLQKLGTAWLASVGVVSVVVGLAAQSTLSNLVSGISLVLYRPFRIGDRVQVAAPTGTEIGVVESIDLGYTTLRTADGRRLVIPNATIASQTSINLSLSHPAAPCGVALTVTEGGDIARARQILLDVATKVPKITKVDGCFVTGVSSQGTVLTLIATCADPGDATQIKSDLLESAKKQFDAAGVKIA